MSSVVVEYRCDGWIMVCVYFFFFQAEDGIRDYKVTGVQTCALPIYKICYMPTCWLLTTGAPAKYK